MPVSAPFQPACAAPITRAFGSTNRIGPQSAAVTPMRDAFGPRDDGVRPRPRGALPGSACDHGIRRMNLVHAQEMIGRDAHLLRHPPAVFRDVRGSSFEPSPPLRPA